MVNLLLFTYSQVNGLIVECSIIRSQCGLSARFFYQGNGWGFFYDRDNLKTTMFSESLQLFPCNMAYTLS